MFLILQENLECERAEYYKEILNLQLYLKEQCYQLALWIGANEINKLKKKSIEKIIMYNLLFLFNELKSSKNIRK